MGQPLTSYEVAAQAQTVLSESPVHALRKLRVDWDGHRLMLAGRVSVVLSQTIGPRGDSCGRTRS